MIVERVGCPASNERLSFEIFRPSILPALGQAGDDGDQQQAGQPAEQSLEPDDKARRVFPIES